MAAARGSSVTELRRLLVSPPQASVPSATLPLSFFDALWLQLPPVKRLLFFQLSVSTGDFQTHHFPALAAALSAALQLFFPLAGGLATDASGDHVIDYTQGDAVSLTLAESNAGFHHLAGNHPRDAAELHPFAPPLLESEGGEKKPVFALQVTVFPFAGVCIGYSLHHAAADGSSIAHFMRSWAEFMTSVGAAAVKDPPLFDRRLVGDLEQLKREHIEEMKRVQAEARVGELSTRSSPRGRLVRITCVLTRSEIEKLRARVAALCRDVGPRPSTFVVTCAYLWTCLVKARGDAEGKTVHLAFATDCRSRLRPPVPATYFGNCIGAAFVEADGADVAGEKGIAAAAEAIHRAVRRLEEGALTGATNWVPKLLSLAADRVLSIAGSPRLKVYATDFGWGPPRKTEVLSIEETGAISLSESADGDGGVEIGMVGPDMEMGPLVQLFEAGLEDF